MKSINRMLCIECLHWTLCQTVYMHHLFYLQHWMLEIVIIPNNDDHEGQRG